MLGIPTRSDVTIPEYQQALAQSRLLERTGNFRNLTSDILLHNHIVYALRQAGEDVFLADRVLEKGFPMPKRALRYLDPEAILQSYLEDIEEVKQAIQEAGPLLDQRYDVKTLKEPWTGPLTLSEIPESAWVTVIDGNMKDLLLRDLYLLEIGLKEAYDASDSPDKNLQRMWRMLEYAEQMDMFRHPPTELTFHDSSKLYEMETYNREVARLVKANERIGLSSDASLRFDEFYVECGRPHKTLFIPASGTFLEIDRYVRDSHDLWNRIGIRDFLADILEGRNRVIINGYVYRRQNGSFITPAEPHREVVNILAKPVRFDGQIAEPDEWAVREDEMVRDFREGNVDPEEVFELYEGFGDPLTASREEMLSNVSHMLRKRDVNPFDRYFFLRGS